MANIRPFIPYLQRQRAYVPLIVLATFGGALAAALQPWPVKLIVDQILGQAPWPPWLQSAFDAWGGMPSRPSLLFLLVLGGLLVFVLTALLDAALTWMWTRAGLSMVHDLSRDLFARLQRRSPTFHHRMPLGDLMGRITGDCWNVHHLVDTLFFAPLHAFLMVLLMAWLMWRLDAALTWVTLILAPLVVLASMVVGRPLRRAALSKRASESSMQSHLQQMLTGISVVQGFNQEETERNRFRSFAESALRALQRSTLLGSLNQLTSGLLAALGTGGILWLGSHRVLSGHLTVGSLLVFLAYLGMLQAQVKILAGLFTSYQGIAAGLQRVRDLLCVEPEVRDRPGAQSLEDVHGRVAFEGVTYGYEPGRLVLKGIDLALSPGQTVALLGPTGAGKSTLAGLLLRFFDPWEGTITVDGKDLRNLTLGSLRAHVSILFQDPFLLPVSVADNIAYGRPDATRAEVEAAARAAQAHEFVSRLPHGYDTVLAERGGTLSGGERQRLAIARAFLKNAPILILDEPTSALDAGVEEEVMRAMRRLMASRTTLLIAHRLSTVRAADRIAVLHAGRIAECGDHASLLQAGGLYAHYHERLARPGETVEQLPG